MKSFLEYITEEKKLKHLEHPEDLHFTEGEEGLTHAIHTLKSAHENLKGGKSDVSFSVKHDGSPSVVFGTHPETNRFFVASKSAFNKNPKLNYTEEDIKNNHGHDQGLVSKLKNTLKHLPKITPQKGVFQGDFMYGRGDLQHTSRGTIFTPNTLTYSAKKDTEAHRNIQKAHIGLVVHTAYKGKTFQDMEAYPSTDISKFNNHHDVHLISANVKGEHNYSPQQQAEFNSHMNKALESHKALKGDHLYKTGHEQSLKTYANKLVARNEAPSVEGYKNHVIERSTREIKKVKSDKSKSEKTQKLSSFLNHIDIHRNSFQASFDAHAHLQNAKNVLVNVLSSTPQDFEYSVRGKKTSPEGFVVSSGGRTHKLVNRAEFSRANFETQELKKNG